MKEKIKQLFKVGIITLGISSLLINCQKDDEAFKVESQQKSSTNLDVSIFRLKDIENNKNLMRVITKTKKRVSENKTGKMVYNADYDFTINTGYVKVIKANGLKNYTFGISRAVDNGLLENLLLQEQTDNTFYVTLVQYNITAQEKTGLENKQIVDLGDKITFVALEDISDSIFNKLNSDADTCTVFSYD